MFDLAQSPASPNLSERLQDITETLASARTQDAVFQIILEPALDALHACAATVLLTDYGQPHLVRVAMIGYPKTDLSIWQDAVLGDDGPAADALIQRTPLFFEEEAELRARYPDLEAHTGATAPVVASALLPMYLDEQPLGVIVLDFDEPHAFTEEEQRFLRILAAQCAVAFGRARLLRDLETRVKERTQQLERQTVRLEAQQVELTQQSDGLRAANAELDAFALSVSHDLRTPVRHMVGFLSLLRKELDGQMNEKASRYLGVVDGAAERMSTLIDALLELSRTSRQTLRRASVDLDALVDDVRAEVLSETAERNVVWTVGPLPVVTADAELLRQVLMNLLSNALKYTRTRAEARIEVRAEVLATAWRLEVRDNGVGFNPKYAERLFGVFQRMHRQDEFEGVGVGLANVRWIVTRHGGQVWAHALEGQGAVFGFSLPRLPGEEET